MKHLFLFLFVTISSIVWSQTVIIKDQSSEDPLDYVTIGHPSVNNPSIANSKGEADITRFKNMKGIQFRLYGYKSLTMDWDDIVAVGFNIFLKSDIFHMDEHVVSATRWRQSKRELPNQVSVITQKEVALQNPQTAADLLAVGGEVFIQKSQQGGGSPMIRGFASNRLLYSVDGVRMNNAIFRGGNIQNVISLDPFSIERTEILFGPGSVTYGSDAIGGVMSFETLLPEFSANDKELVVGKANTRYSSANNELSAHFDVNVGWRKWAILTSISHNNYGDLRMGRHGHEDYLRPFYVQRIDSVDQVITNSDPLIQNPTGFKQMNLLQKVRYRPTEFLDIQYAFHYSETSSYDRFDRLIETTDNGLPRSAVWQYGPQTWMMNMVSVNFSKKNRVFDHASIRVAQQRFEESRIDRRFNHHRLRTQVEEVHAYSINADFDKQLNEKNSLSYGVEGIINDVRSEAHAIDIRDNSEILVANRYPNSLWSTYSAYLNFIHRFSDKVGLQTGVRYSQFLIDADFANHLEFFPFDFNRVSINNGALNGSIGVVYNPAKDWNFSMNASSGFRAPNVDDIGKIFDFSAGDIIVPNPNLAAEYVYNIDLSATRILSDRIKIDVTGFYTYLDNALVRREFTVNGQDSILYDGDMSKVFAIQNAAFGTVYGFNAGVEAKLGRGFSFRTRFNYQIGVEEMEDGSVSRSRHAAPWFGVTRLIYEQKRLNLQIYALYNGAITAENMNAEEAQKPFIYARDENGDLYSPGWYTLNFKAMYGVNEMINMSAGVENLMDKRYRPYSSGLTAPGRNFIISLMIKF
jgi:hemoglobin/transferrin/lactoferrin receptor protein